MKTIEKNTENEGTGSGSGKNPPALTRDEVLRLSPEQLRNSIRLFDDNLAEFLSAIKRGRLSDPVMRHREPAARFLKCTTV